MSTEAFQRIVPNSSVRYRPLKARTEAIPIITPRTSRRNLKRLPRVMNRPLESGGLQEPERGAGSRT